MEDRFTLVLTYSSVGLQFINHDLLYGFHNNVLMLGMGRLTLLHATKKDILLDNG